MDAEDATVIRCARSPATSAAEAAWSESAKQFLATATGVQVLSRKLIVITAVVGGLSLICVGPLLPQIGGGYLSDVALQIGSTFLLIPIAVWVETKLSRGLEEIRTSLNEESRAIKAAKSIELASRWEDVVPAFERVWSRAYQSALYVKLLNVDAWLGFGTMKQYQLGVDFTPVYIYFADPTLDDKKLDTVVQWSSGITGRQLMEKVASELRRHNRFPGRELFQPGAALEQLREQMIKIVEGQGGGQSADSVGVGEPSTLRRGA